MLKAQIAFNYRWVDALLVLFTLQLSYYVRLQIALGKPTSAEFLVHPWFLFPTALIIWLGVFQIFNVYTASPGWLRPSFFSRLLQAHTVAALAFAGVLYVIERDFSRLQTVYFVVMLLAGMILVRAIAYVVSPRFGLRLRSRRKVMIIGISPYAYEIGRLIGDLGMNRLTLIGFVPHQDETVNDDTEQVIGTFDQLPTLIRDHAIDEVIVCEKSHDRAYLNTINALLTSVPTNVRLAPDYSELAYFQATVEDLGGLPLISLRYDALSRGQRAVKRLFDVVGATLLLIPALPVMALLAIAIRLDSPGPVIFRQVRVGERGKLFTMYKLRTMVWDAESKINYIKNYKHAGDPRVTRVGRWLRRASLDELPQFFNVLKGDMTLVGPRPELPQVVQFYTPFQRKRFEVPQGVTGWWQINGRADLPMYEHVGYDMFYIRNYSIWLDLYILARTPLALISGRGAY